MITTEFKVIGKLSNVELSTSNKGIMIATCIITTERVKNNGEKTFDKFKVVAFSDNATKLANQQNDNVIVFGHINANNYQGHYNNELIADSITCID